MQITILAVGDNKFPFLREGEKLYIERLSHYASVTMECVASEKFSSSCDISKQLERESKRLVRRIPKNSLVCVLDQKGKPMSSEGFAEIILSWQNRSISKICFCIGGPFGLYKDFISKTDAVLSLSPMTFPHDLIRIMFLEQLYRAFTILKGEKYHK